MPWTKITRPHYVRRGRRYASDSTDAEWELVAGFLPPPKRTGRPRTTELRDVLDAILYMAASGCQWAMLPNDFPPPSTVQRYFYDWRDTGLLRTINHHLVMAAREAETPSRSRLPLPLRLYDLLAHRGGRSPDPGCQP